MTFEIDISSNIKEVQRTLKQIEKKVVVRAASSALNKTGTTVRAEAARRVSKATGLKVGRVKSQLNISKANRGRLTWVLTPNRRQTNLIEFVTPAKQRPGAFRKKAGVSSKAWRKAKTYPGTFIGRGRNSGKALVFKRDGRKKLSVVYGPSVIGQFIKEVEGLNSFAIKRFKTVFEKQMKFELSKINSK